MIDKKMIMSLFICAIMILSVIGFVLVDYSSGEETKKTYNGYKFIRTQNGWKGNINGEKITFNYLPDQTEDINITPQAKTQLQTTPILAITYDPNSKWAQDYGALQYYLEQTLNSQTRYLLRAVTNNTKYPTIPQITCKNATSQLPVAVLTMNTTQDKTQMNYANNCLTITATKTNEIYRATDRLIYIILGVMKE